MTNMRTYFVDCTRDDVVIRTYGFGVPNSRTGPGSVDHDHLVGQAKANLMTEGLGSPPYVGIASSLRAA
jgi:hypothetical protein